ncbi:MAG: hypothetical protein NTX36_01155 [Proteobacteria bacterium]|nr:hypothetical protein [Pseudomonadota bacterium]
MIREKFKWRTHENESTDAGHRGGPLRSSDEGRQCVWSEGGGLSNLIQRSTILMGGTAESGAAINNGWIMGAG